MRCLDPTRWLPHGGMFFAGIDGVPTGETPGTRAQLQPQVEGFRRAAIPKADRVS